MGPRRSTDPPLTSSEVPPPGPPAVQQGPPRSISLKNLFPTPQLPISKTQRQAPALLAPAALQTDMRLGVWGWGWKLLRSFLSEWVLSTELGDPGMPSGFSQTPSPRLLAKRRDGRPERRFNSERSPSKSGDGACRARPLWSQLHSPPTEQGWGTAGTAVGGAAPPH